MTSASFQGIRPGPGPGDLQLGPDQPQQRLVLLHGWGADAADLLDLGQELVEGLTDLRVDLVALQAPDLHPAGMGRQWYGLAPAPDWSALPAARQALRQRLEQLGASVPLSRTALLGFSQGGAMAVDVATCERLPLAALISCSGYPHPDWQPQAEGLAVLLTHGRQDPVVPAAACEALEQQLQAAGATVSQRLFEGGHGIDPSLFTPMRAFLRQAWERA